MDHISANSTQLDNDHSTTQLQLSIGSSEIGDKAASRGSSTTSEKGSAEEQLRIAVAEKAYAEEARQVARRQMELAEQEFANAKRIRQQAQAELEKAQALKEHATKQMNSTIMQITCHSCKHKFQQHDKNNAPASASSSSMGLSYISAALREWEFRSKTDSNTQN